MAPGVGRARARGPCRRAAPGRRASRRSAGSASGRRRRGRASRAPAPRPAAGRSRRARAGARPARVRRGLCRRQSPHIGGTGVFLHLFGRGGCAPADPACEPSRARACDSRASIAAAVSTARSSGRPRRCSESWPACATSACARMPTSRPSSSTTGRRRTWCSAISRAASSRLCCGSIVTTSFDAISPTVVSALVPLGDDRGSRCRGR